MGPINYKWRDRILVPICWGIALFSAMGSWSTVRSPQELTITLQNISQNFEYYFFVIFLFIILLFPLFIFILHKTVSSESLSDAVAKFQHPRTYWLTVLLFSVGQLLLFPPDLRESLVLELLIILLVLLIILWHFYRRTVVDIRKLILAVIFGAAIIIMRGTLINVPEGINVFEASLFVKSYFIFHVVVLFVLVFLPLLFLFKKCRQTLIVVFQKWFEKIPAASFAITFIFASFWIFGFFWTQEDTPLGILALRIGMLVITFSIGGMLLRVFSDYEASNQRIYFEIGKKQYVVLLGLLLVVYVIFAIGIGTNNLERLDPDGLVYMIIGREYAQGNPVVRGYWSPLISWLIAPLISIGINPHGGFLLVIGLFGFVWILISTFLARQLGLGRASRLVVATSILIITLSYGFTTSTPDFLGAVLITLYFYWLMHPKYEDQPIKYGILVGLTGALAYFAKYYNLPFVLAHLLLTAILHILHGRRVRSIAIGTVAGIVVLIVSISPWLLAMHNRYDGFTVSTSGAIAHAVIGPKANPHPCFYRQLCDQPSDVLIPWEDPRPQYYNAYGWSPFESLENFRYLVQLIKESYWHWALVTIFILGPFIPLSLLSSGIATLFLWSNSERRLQFSWIFLTSFLYTSGYMFAISFPFRYYLAIIPILLMAGYFFLQELLGRVKGKLSRIRFLQFDIFTIVILVISVLSLGQLDYIQLYFTNSYDTCLKDGSEVIEPYLKGPIAGTDWQVNYVAYYTDTRTLGVVQPDMMADEADSILREFGVQTFLASSESDISSELPAKYKYTVLLKSSICDVEYSILKVPER